jgi:hypothetical protein
VYRHWWQPTTVITEGPHYIAVLVCMRCTMERRWKVHRLTGGPIGNSYNAPKGYYQHAENGQQAPQRIAYRGDRTQPQPILITEDKKGSLKMSKRLIQFIEWRDDLDGELGEDIKTYEFEWVDATKREIDLRDSNFALFAQDMQRWLEVARPVKRRSHKKKQPNAYVFDAKPAARGAASPLAWSKQIGTWAVEHGLEWSDPEVRRAVRQWATDTGRQCAATGLIPRPTMQAYVEAHKDQLARRDAVS